MNPLRLACGVDNGIVAGSVRLAGRRLRTRRRRRRPPPCQRRLPRQLPCRIGHGTAYGSHRRRYPRQQLRCGGAQVYTPSGDAIGLAALSPIWPLSGNAEHQLGLPFKRKTSYAWQPPMSRAVRSSGGIPIKFAVTPSPRPFDVLVGDAGEETAVRRRAPSPGPAASNVSRSSVSPFSSLIAVTLAHICLPPGRDVALDPASARCATDVSPTPSHQDRCTTHTPGGHVKAPPLCQLSLDCGAYELYSGRRIAFLRASTYACRVPIERPKALPGREPAG